MLDVEKFQQARWDELYRFFTDGYPPLIFQLLLINTIFFVFFVVRRLRAKHHMRHTTAYLIQFLLIGANMAVMFQKDWIGQLRLPSGLF
jgi:hypothetical protein